MAEKAKGKIYFIGIGGIGVSALARYYLSYGFNVFGSDLCASETTEDLVREGAKIYIGKHLENRIKRNICLLIYSLAVTENNPELKKARQLGIEVKSYAEAVGDLTKKYFTLCVAGSHGKSTVAAMTALILIKAGIEPTVILGTKLKEFNNKNFYQGAKEKKYKTIKPILVLEADEWHASFLNYSPNAILLTNIDKEHLDYYHNWRNILTVFIRFIQLLPQGGLLVADKQDRGIGKVLKKIKADSRLKIVDYNHKYQVHLEKRLTIPGEHNLRNALGAATLCENLGVKQEIIFEALAEFKGSWRRLSQEDKKINIHTVKLINDYAHHPTEIKASLKAIKERYPQSVLWVVFQPHQNKRLNYLFNDFVGALDQADRLILLPVYEVAGRDQKKLELDTKDLQKALEKRRQENKHKFTKANKIYYRETFKEAAVLLREKIKKDDIVVLMGAGNIWEMNKLL